MWWAAIPLGIVGLLAALAKKGSQKTTAVNYKVGRWLPFIEPFATAARISVPFAMEWTRIESGGNPCAWGTAKAKGPDGHPREQGIGQFYNPDDMNRLGIPSGAFRVYCVPNSQNMSRELTDEEMTAQAKALVDLIAHCREVAGAAVAKSHLSWSGKDMYKLVKLVHGLPGLVKQGIPRTTAKLGRPPRDWIEFKVAIDKTTLDEGTERYRSLFPRLFLNAEKTTSTLPDDVRIVS